MPDLPLSHRPTLVVLASTYPRWNGDHEPGFVHELAKRLTGKFRVIAIVPSAPGALGRETLDGVEVIRYRYAPRPLETLVNDGGIVTNLRRHRWKMLLVPTFVLAQAWRTWRALHTYKVDVLHAHWLLPQGLIAALLGKLSRRSPPFLITSHGADLFALQGNGSSQLKRFVIRKAAATTVVSEAMRTELTRIGVDAGKVRVQPMGVDLRHKFTPDPMVKRSRDEILFVGRLVEKKGLRHLIDAMPKILIDTPQAFLTIAGFGPEEGALRLQVQSLGLKDAVRFLGAVSQDQLPGLYRRAAVFVAPFMRARSGDQDGLGLVCIEALGCGCPVVTSDSPATRDVLSNGPGCIRVAGGEGQAIAQAVSEVLENGELHCSGARARREHIFRIFDWDNVSRSYADMLGACFDGRY